MAERIRVGVLGVGEHGEHHARHYAGTETAELAGVYDVRVDRCRQVASELGVRAFTSLEEALRSIQAASIVIPTTEHAAVTRRAFELGVDVLLEKPISRTVEEADELIRLSESSGRILQVGHIERFNPGVVAAKPITHRPLFFEVHRLGVFSPRSLDVDVVYDLMIHDLDLVLWLTDAAPREVRAVGLPVLTNKVDIANARVEFENGAVANFTASRVSTEKVRKFRYFQPDEYISIDFSRQDALVISVDRTKPNPEMGFRKLETRPVEPLRAEIDAFLDSVRTRRAPLAGGREGRAALALAAEVMDCIERHADQVHLNLSRSAGHAGEI
ncbi:MAG: Gfo/Idh/MocA family oxidoreductase [Terriglobia bacterium]